MGEETLTLATIINSLGSKYDVLDLVDYLADIFYIDNAEKKQEFREMCLYSQREQAI